MRDSTGANAGANVGAVPAPTSTAGVPVLDLDRWSAQLPTLRERYRSAAPFPHIVIDNFLVPEAAQRAATEFPEDTDASWISYLHVNERKYANTDPASWGPTQREVVRQLQSPEFVAFLSELTGIDDLLIDETLEGAGLHQTFRGGYLNIHADFTVHPKRRHWRRRCNVLVYLNSDWEPEYGGDLELWSKDMTTLKHKVAPILNRAVIFTTLADSFHGHPDPLRCPPERSRRSMALYYFTEDADPEVQSTEYRARPGDGWKAIPIFVDKTLVRGYDALKRRMRLSDEQAARLLRPLDRYRRKRPGRD